VEAGCQKKRKSATAPKTLRPAEIIPLQYAVLNQYVFHKNSIRRKKAQTT
jgi:hypothetical protein